jgi:ABC-type Fe3+-hydroxamate transport system substrate-binding protein
MPPVVDDLGHAVTITRPAKRVVSLVPSLTEAVAATVPEALVGATDWCTHPADLDVARIRGTKNPDTRAIAALSPDLVIANKEENRELDVRRLREAGLAVWVTDIETLDDAFTSLERLFDTALGWPLPDWLEQAREVWAAPPPPEEPRVAVAIWRDPWMWVGPTTFTGDLLSRAGIRNVLGDRDRSQGRYPTLTIDEVESLRPDAVLLPDEPYVFTPDDGPEAFTRTPTDLVYGRLLTWYGPSLVPARAHLDEVRERTRRR